MLLRTCDYNAAESPTSQPNSTTMPVYVGPLDPETLRPSPYRGVTKIQTPLAGHQEYMFYDVTGQLIGKVIWNAKYVSPAFERMLEEMHALCDPDEKPESPRLRLEA